MDMKTIEDLSLELNGKMLKSDIATPESVAISILQELSDRIHKDKEDLKTKLTNAFVETRKGLEG